MPFRNLISCSYFFEVDLFTSLYGCLSSHPFRYLHGTNFPLFVVRNSISFLVYYQQFLQLIMHCIYYYVVGMGFLQLPKNVFPVIKTAQPGNLAWGISRVTWKQLSHYWSAQKWQRNLGKNIWQLLVSLTSFWIVFP